MEEVRQIHVNRNLSKTDPVKDVMGRIRGSSFQVDFAGAQYTMTNLHVCRLANHRRNFIKMQTVVLPIKNKEGNYLTIDFPTPLTDSDLISEKIMIGNTPRKILAVDSEHDLCILSPDLSKPSLSLANSYQMQEKISVVGHPRGLPKTVREGRIIARGRNIFPWISRTEKKLAFMITSIGYGGNSGSPIIDRFGRLVGVLFAGNPRYHTEMLVVPLEAVRRFLKEQTGN